MISDLLRPRYHAPVRALVWLLATMVLAGCAGTAAERDAEARRQETVDEILNAPLDEAAYGGTPRRCISEFAFRDFQAIGDRYLVFEGPGDQLWVNEIRGRCPGLDRSASLAFKQTGMQICELDQFKVVDMFTWARYQRWPWHWLEGIPCTLGKFQPVSPEQVEALRATLR